MRKIASFIIPIATLLLLASPALAQNQWRFELFGAGTFPIDKKFEIAFPQSSEPMDGIQEFSAGAGGGVRLGTDGRGHWGQDFVYSFGTNASRIINRTTNAQFGFSSRVHQVSYNALWYPGGLRRGTVFPFLTAGIGTTFFTLRQSAINEALDPNRAGIGKLRSDNIFAFNAGAGVRWRMSRSFGFRVDVRDYMTRPARYSLPKSSDDPNATVFPVGGIFHQLQVSIAVVYYFPPIG